MIQIQLADPVFTGQRTFQLFQQNQPVTQDNDLFTSIKLFNDFTGENGFARPGRALIMKRDALSKYRETRQ